MLADGAQPTATTYASLISAYGKTGQVGMMSDCMFSSHACPYKMLISKLYMMQRVLMMNTSVISVQDQENFSLCTLHLAF